MPHLEANLKILLCHAAVLFMVCAAFCSGGCDRGLGGLGRGQFCGSIRDIGSSSLQCLVEAIIPAHRQASGLSKVSGDDEVHADNQQGFVDIL